MSDTQRFLEYIEIEMKHHGYANRGSDFTRVYGKGNPAELVVTVVGAKGAERLVTLTIEDADKNATIERTIQEAMRMISVQPHEAKVIENKGRVVYEFTTR